MIAPQGPHARASRAPVARCVAAISKTGAVCAASIDAGDYLCNQTLYASLGESVPIVAFLHVPKPRRLRAPRKGRADKGWARKITLDDKITLDEMAEGAFAAIVEMAKAARRQSAA